MYTINVLLAFVVGGLVGWLVANRPLHVEVWFRSAGEQPRAPSRQDAESLPPVPEDIQRLAAAESEPFARQAILDEAQNLYDHTRDWNAVLRFLLRRYGTKE